MGSSPSSLDALGRPLNLSEPQCPHLRNATTQHLPPSTAVRNELLVCVKCAQRATRATRGVHGNGGQGRGLHPTPCPDSPSVMGLLSSWSEPIPARGLPLCSVSAKTERRRW